MAKNSCILVIPDLHTNYEHPDAFRFLRAIKKKYRPDRIINLGDIADLQSVSYHEKNPDLDSPGRELENVRKKLNELYRIFPKMDILTANHDSLFYRKGQTIGLPSGVLKSYNEIFQVNKSWKWHQELVIKASNGEKIYFCHGLSPDGMKNSKSKAMSFVSGHHHSKFEIRYWANTEKLYFAMICGCLVDRKSIAFAYGKNVLDKPILGCALIINGIPRLIPMNLTKSGHWDGSIS
jgi:predicted phosphodiesterase